VLRAPPTSLATIATTEPSGATPQITCGSRLLYGGADAGYFPCVLYDGARRDVVGSDPSSTVEDRDAAMSLNTIGGSLEIHDDASGPNGAMRVLAHVDTIE
jgi:hypothetical protein